MRRKYWIPHLGCFLIKAEKLLFYKSSSASLLQFMAFEKQSYILHGFTSSLLAIVAIMSNGRNKGKMVVQLPT